MGDSGGGGADEIAMVKAFMREDVHLWRYKIRSFVVLAVCSAALMVAQAGGFFDMGGSLLGAESARSFLIVLIGTAAFLDFYADSLATDKKAGVLARVALSGVSEVGYITAKMVPPLGIGVVVAAVALFGMLLAGGLGWPSMNLVGFGALVLLGELVLVAGLGMVLNVVGDVDINGHPSIVVPFVLVSALVAFLTNPVERPLIFAAVALGLGVLLHVASAVLLMRRYRGTVRCASA